MIILGTGLRTLLYVYAKEHSKIKYRLRLKSLLGVSRMFLMPFVVSYVRTLWPTSWLRLLMASSEPQFIVSFIYFSVQLFELILTPKTLDLPDQPCFSRSEMSNHHCIFALTMTPASIDCSSLNIARRIHPVG